MTYGGLSQPINDLSLLLNSQSHRKKGISVEVKARVHGVRSMTFVTLPKSFKFCEEQYRQPRLLRMAVVNIK